MCSEFEVMFKPYSEQSLDKEFEKALENLPIPYHSKNPQHRRMYAKFIATYGSHYTSKVVLGAKRILTTSMSTQSVAELTKESVDISSALSVKMQVSFCKRLSYILNRTEGQKCLMSWYFCLILSFSGSILKDKFRTMGS